MPKITLEKGKEIIISQEKYDVLVKEVKPEKDWRAERGKKYWHLVSYDGVASSYYEEGESRDDYRHAIGNYFRTEEEALAYGDEQLENGERNKAIRRVNARIKQLKDGWVEDWTDPDQQKWNLHFNYAQNRFEVKYGYRTDFLSVFANAKSNEIADQIIKEMDDDLRVILGKK